MKLGKYIFGLISGLTFGLLFAPKKGDQLRKEIMKKGSKDPVEGLKVVGGALKSAWGEAKEEAINLKDSEEMQEFLANAQDKMGQVKDYIGSEIEEKMEKKK